MLIPSKILLHQSIISILHAFQKKGVFAELLKDANGLSVNDFEERLSLKKSVLLPLCDFLAVNAPEILSKKDDRYFLGSQYKEKNFQNALFFSLAYESVFTNLSDLLSGEKEYKRDFLRDGEYLSISSAIYNSLAWDCIIDTLKNLKFNSVIDIGCGAGDFLYRIKQSYPGANCFGVEFDKKAIDLFNKNAQGGNSQVFITEGDAAFPEKWKDMIVKKKTSDDVVITGVTLWHEFLYFGDDYLIDLFKRYRSLFPGGIFIFVEYNSFLFSEFKELPFSLKESASVYQLVHPLTMQGVPPKKNEWLSIIKRSGMTLKSEIFVEPNSTVYVCVL